MLFPVGLFVSDTLSNGSIYIWYLFRLVIVFLVSLLVFGVFSNRLLFFLVDLFVSDALSNKFFYVRRFFQ